jgi:hypothetical protein
MQKTVEFVGILFGYQRIGKRWTGGAFIPVLYVSVEVSFRLVSRLTRPRASQSGGLPRRKTGWIAQLP